MNTEQQKTKTFGLILIGCAHLLHDIFSSFLAPLLPLLRAKHGLTFAMCGILSSAQRLPSLLTPFIGIIADKYSLKVLISLAPFLTSISMSLLGLAPNYITLIILLLTMGFTNALFHVPAPVLAKSIAGKRIGLAMSIFMIGGQLARTIGPIIITVAVAWWGLEGTWRLIIPGFILSLFTYLFIRNITSEDFDCKKNIYRHFYRFIILFFLMINIYYIYINFSLPLYVDPFLNFLNYNRTIAKTESIITSLTPAKHGILFILSM